MLIGLVFHPGKRRPDRDQKIWPWCCCLLAMLRSVVIGAKQCVVDKVRGVKQQQQVEIRLTRASTRRILIADKQEAWCRRAYQRGWHSQEGSAVRQGPGRKGLCIGCVMWYKTTHYRLYFQHILNVGQMTSLGQRGTPCGRHSEAWLIQ